MSLGVESGSSGPVGMHPSVRSRPAETGAEMSSSLYSQLNRPAASATASLVRRGTSAHAGGTQHASVGAGRPPLTVGVRGGLGRHCARRPCLGSVETTKVAPPCTLLAQRSASRMTPPSVHRSGRSSVVASSRAMLRPAAGCRLLLTFKVAVAATAAHVPLSSQTVKRKTSGGGGWERYRSSVPNAKAAPTLTGSPAAWRTIVLVCDGSAFALMGGGGGVAGLSLAKVRLPCLGRERMVAVIAARAESTSVAVSRKMAPTPT
eukprot:scaffold107269_cov57-Phaeocystis_antarctica.AAC.3